MTGNTSKRTILLSEILTILQQKNIPFAAFRLPGKELQIYWSDSLNSDGLSAFVLAPFQSGNFPEIRIPGHQILTVQSAVNELERTLITLRNTPIQAPIPAVGNMVTQSKKEYIQTLNQAIGNMEQEGIEKFIYSRLAYQPKPRGFNLFKYLQDLQEAYPATLVYYVQHPQGGCWLGATPETLGIWNQSTFRTMALAGTMAENVPYHKWGIKEKEEHQYVVDYMANTFSRNQIAFHQSPTQVTAAGPVFHLKTTLESQLPLSYSQALSLIRELHPTPAICGVPLSNAQAFIGQNEPYERAYYTGYVGLIAEETAINLFVNLRCMQVLPNQLNLYLGGGITQKSDAQSEWEETQHKAKTLVNLLPQ